MALPTNQEIDNAIRTSNTGTDADRPIRLSTNELLKAFRQEIANTQQDLANKVNNSTFNALADVARTGSYNDISGRPQQYGGTGQNTDGYMTQKAVTDALDNKADLVGGKVPFEQLPSSLASGVVFKGTWNAATNQDNSGNPLPAAPVADGEYYIVNTAGTQFGLTFVTGDWIIAVDGQWYKLEPDSAVSSVNEQTGAVVIDVGVTSVGVTVPAGLVVTNTPITSAGTIDIALGEGYKIPTQEELNNKGVEPPAGWLEPGNETKYLAGDGTLKDIPSDTQSDYAQTDPNAPDYIKNKPALFSGSYNDLSDKPTIPTKTSELTNDSEFITDASLAGLNDKVDAALTKTFAPWQPEVIGTDIDETKYPQNPEGKGYEIIDLAQPTQWNELGKEVKNGDFIVFDNDGIPKEVSGEEVDLGEYTKRSADETVTGDWIFTGGISVGDAKFGVPFKPNFAPTAFPAAFSFNSTENVSVNLFDVHKGTYYLMATRADTDYDDNDNPIDSVAFVIGAQSESGDVAGLSLVVGDSGEIDASLTIHNNGASYSLGLDENGKGYLGGGGSKKYLATEDFVKDSKIQVKEILTANKTLTAADSGKLLIINADGITITMPDSSDFNIDIAKMDEDFITIVQCVGADKFREDTDTISVIRDVSITNTNIVGKEWLAIGAYEA